MVAPDDTLRTCLVALTLRSYTCPAVESLREVNLLPIKFMAPQLQIYGRNLHLAVWPNREPGPADAAHRQWPTRQSHVNNLYIRLYKQPNIFVHKNYCIHIYKPTEHSYVRFRLVQQVHMAISYL